MADNEQEMEEKEQEMEEKEQEMEEKVLEIADQIKNKSTSSSSEEEKTDLIEEFNFENVKALAMKNPVAAGLVAVFSLYLIFGYGADLIVTALGFAYPAYQSVKAVESPQKDDDTQWLIYWVVFGCFNIVEFFSDILLSWFPLYFLTKLIFLTWCMAPVKWNGADTIYNRVIKPFVLKHQKKIDSALDKVGEQVDKYAHEAKDAATEAAIRAATEDKKDN